MRLIAKLDVKPPFLVKPVHFEGLRKLGRPADFAKKYSDLGIDEIFYIDIVASLYERDILYNEVQDIADIISVPFAVGGGVKNITSFSKLFHVGADKVVLNTFPLQFDPKIINDAAKVFGSQSVVVNIEAKKINGKYYCLTDCGRILSSKEVVNWSIEAEDRGAGEILLQSVDKDGRMTGYDIDLAAKVVESINIPVVIASGAGKVDHVKELIKNVIPSGIAIASLLHYDLSSINEIKKSMDL